MTIEENEAIACLKVLILLAEADGVVDDGERKSLAGAATGFQIPESVDQLLADREIDLATELAKITSDEAREQLYRSAFFMAHADGTMANEEKVFLEKVAAAIKPSAALQASLESTFAAAPPSKASAFLAGLGGLFKRKPSP
jgi:uncharacterized membrane protein YebE (DUF533 family)